MQDTYVFKDRLSNVHSLYFLLQLLCGDEIFYKRQDLLVVKDVIVK